MKRPTAVCAMVLLLWGCRGPAPRGEAVAASISPQSSDPADTTAAPTNSFPVPTRTTLPEPEERSAIPPSPSPTDSSAGAELAFVGDIMLGRSIGDRIRRGDAVFASVEPILQAADLAVGNLECAIGEDGVKAPKYYTFLAPPESAALLKRAGFGLLSLANNHSFDYGIEAFEQTMAMLESNGLAHVGAGFNDAQARAPAVFTVGGLRLAFLAYAEVPKEYTGGFDPKSWTAGPDTPGISWADDDKIIRDLEAVSPVSDFLVVLFHYGDEGVDVPNPRQIQLSRLAIDYGADLVVGSHPHVLQGEEEYRGGRIFYSLGNFVFDEFDGKANRSAILWVKVYPGAPVEYNLIRLNLVDGIPRMGE
ncbi:MAG: CapA family protein [Anaerolineales bacterium]|nr:CapA family protein [Anaerolineales bacterium]